MGKKFACLCLVMSSIFAVGDSAFSQQAWIKICIGKEGIYKVSAEDLKAIGVNTGQIDPDELQLFNNGGRALPEDMFYAIFVNVTLNPRWLKKCLCILR